MTIYINYQELVTTKKGHRVHSGCAMFRFTELYKSFGIECKIKSADDKEILENKKTAYQITMGEANHSSDKGLTESDKLYGYSCFYSDINFDENGNFVDQGFLE